MRTAAVCERERGAKLVLPGRLFFSSDLERSTDGDFPSFPHEGLAIIGFGGLIATIYVGQTDRRKTMQPAAGKDTWRARQTEEWRCFCSNVVRGIQWKQICTVRITAGRNNFGKKVPILYFIRKKIALHVHVEFCIPIYCDFSLVRGVISTLCCGHSLSQSVLPVENGEGNFQDNRWSIMEKVRGDMLETYWGKNSGSHKM